MTRYLTMATTILVLAAAPALAQINVPGPINSADGKSSRPHGRVPAAPPPVGVPGSRADTDLTAPSQAVVTDMPPTDALFDAINRGDLTATRDAIARGADIQGHNVLGLTPLELSVDLGRNSISFLLLSLRGGAGYGNGSAPRQASAAPPARPSAADRRAEAAAERQARREQVAAERSNARQPASPRTAALFAGNGGAPAPNAGFLGFDAAR